MTALNESTLVVIPTFNERENLPGVIARLRAAEPSVDILVVDDSSPVSYTHLTLPTNREV